jgi:hypothetical protein
MSSVGDAFSGATSGATDTSGASSFGDTPNLTDSDFSGLTDANITGNASDAGGGGFNSISNLTNLLSGGSTSGTSSVGAQSAAMTPPSAAATTGGDPTGAAGGTQSATMPGSTPANTSQPQQTQQQQSEHAPPDAVNQLKALIKGLSGKPQGPTGQVPTPQAPTPPVLPQLAARETGAQSPQMPLPSVSPGKTGAQSPQMPLPTLSAGETGPPSPTEPQQDADGNPLTVAGTPAKDTPLPPPRPGDQAAAATAPSTTGGKPTPQTDDQGRPITVQPTATADLPTKTGGLPTKKGGPTPAPATAAQPSRMIQDITGVSTGVPTALPELAKAAMALAPLIGMMMGGGRGRRGHFHGGRFTHGFGGGRGGFGGRHPPSRGPWPYHHPMHGWDMHHMHPGGGWRPLSPQDAQGMGLLGGGQQPGGQNGQDPNAPDPNRPPKETGATPGPASDTASGAIPGASAKDVDDYTRQVAQKYMIDPNVASKILAQESSYGQARHPGDNGTSFGPFQLHFAKDGNAMGDQFKRDTGLDPRDPRTWKQQVDYAMMKASTEGWTPWTTSMKKLGMNQWSGITTNRRFAGLTTGNQQPDRQVNISPTTLPPSSQPMVAG